MVMDLVLLLLLLVLYVAVGGALPRWRGPGRLDVRRWLRDPLLRVVVLAGALVLTGWATTLAVAGAGGLRDLAGGRPVQDERTRDDCFRMQRVGTLDLEMALEGGQVERAAGVLPGPHQRCPHGGTWLLDAEGRLACDLHGRPDDAPALWTGDR